MKKFLIGFAVALVLLLAALISLPYLFRDQIMAEVKKAANENLTAQLDFSDVDISVFRHFPKLSVGLENLSVTGSGPFDGVKLVQCPRLDIAVNLWSAIFGDQIRIEEVHLESPDIRVYVLSNGQANYDITKPTPETAPAAETGGGIIQLEHYAIHNGKILYDDRSLDMRAELNGLNHEGSGEFTADIYDLVMKTSVDQLTVEYEGMEYLSRAKADWKATVNADMKNMKFTLKENDLQVNALRVLLDGWVALPNDVDITMDMTFGTPENTFKSLLSIVPGAYTKDFDQVQANGTVQFAGFFKGAYNETSYPAFRIDMKVDNADFKYPALPLGVSNIHVDASVNSPSSRLNDMVVNIPKFSLRIGSNPLQGHFSLRTPETDPTVDTKINGTLNLGELAQAFPMEGVQKLSGILRANVEVKAAMSQIDQQRYEDVQMAGVFALQNMEYHATDMPPVRINTLETTLTPQRVEIRDFDARLGKSDIKASGAIDNILAYFSTTKTMRGNLTLRSNLFDANEWLTEEASAADSKTPSDMPAAAEEAPFDAWDFTVDGAIGRLKYDVYDIRDMALKGHFAPNKMDIEQFGMQIGASDLAGSGRILNAWNYLFDNQTVSGVVNLRSNYFDLNPFMTEETPAATEPVPASVMLVPENIDMTINADFKQLKYTTYTLNNLDGQIAVRNGVAALNDCTAGILGGQVALSGSYNTQNPAKPAFDMNLALQNMGFRDAYSTFVTMQKAAPIAQLIEGKFNTTLTLAGILGADMTPDFATLSAAGFLETLNATLNNFKGLSEIATRLNSPSLSRLSLGNSRNWFEIKDGKVLVKPFNLQAGDVAMQIGGSHGLNQEMSYQILTKTPRKTLEKSGVGAAASGGLSWVSAEAAKYGVNVAQGEFINIRFDLTGSLTNPKVAVKVLGTDGQRTIQQEAQQTVQATIDKARDSLTNVASRELDKAKQQAQAAAQKAADSLQRVAQQKIDEAKQQMGEQVGKEVEKKAGEVLGTEGQKKVDEAKKKLEEWDPFKKKKKNN